MSKERVYTYKNTGTLEEPNWEIYFVKTLAECILMSDADGETKNIKDYVDEAIDKLVNGAPEALDTLKELADAIKENEDIIDLLNNAVISKADKTELLFTNSTPTVQAHGGIAAGSTFNEVPVTQVLNDILYPWIAPVLSITTTPNGGTYEKGVTKTVTSVKVTVTKKSHDITKLEIFSTDGTTLLGSKSGDDLSTINSSGRGSITFTVNSDITNNGSFKTVATDSAGKTTGKTSTAFSFVYPYYYGTIDSDATIDTSTITALNKKVEAKGTKTISFTASDQKIVFATPVSNGVIKLIKDPNGFDITSTYTQSTVFVTGLDETAQSYYVYVTNDPTTVSDFNITFSH